MTMFTSLSIVISLLLNYVSAIIVNNQNLTHVTNDSFLDPIVLKKKNELIYLSFLKINSKIRSNISSNSSSVRCEFEIDSPNDRIFQTPRAAVLGNDKVVVTFIEIRYKDKVTDPGVFIDFYVMNLDDGCSRVNFSMQTDYKILTSYDPLVIIPYEDSFDVFIASLTHCKPAGSICMLKYSDGGKSLGARNFNYKTTSVNFDLEKIHAITPFRSNDGYFYFSKSNSTVLKLNENLKIIQSRKFKGFIRSHSVLDGNVAVCSRIYDAEVTTECVKLDSNLRVRARYRLGSSDDTRIRRVKNLKDGSSLLLTFRNGKDTRLEVRRLMVGGFVSEAEEFAYNCENFVANPPGQFFELEGVYCFVFRCRFEQITHCLRAKDAKKLTRRANFETENELLVMSD